MMLVTEHSQDNDNNISYFSLHSNFYNVHFNDINVTF